MSKREKGRDRDTGAEPRERGHMDTEAEIGVISLGMPGVASSPGSWEKMQIHLHTHFTPLKAPPRLPVVSNSSMAPALGASAMDSPSVSEGSNPASSLISDFWPPDRERIHVCCC